MKSFLFLLSFLMLSQAFSQQTYTKKYQKEAKKIFDEGKYFEASDKCAEAFEKIKTSSPQLKSDFAFMTAESYRFIEKYKESLKWYDKAIEFKLYETKPEIILYKANIHFMLGDIKQAKKSYTRLKNLLKNTKDPLLKLAENGVVSCKKSKEFELEQKRYIIKNENGLNKKSMDMASVVYGKGSKQQLFLSSTRKGSTGDVADPISGEEYMDIWVSNIDKQGNWGEPYVLPGDINTPFSEGMVSFTNNNKTMFFTRCPVIEKQNLGCEIFKADYKSKKWINPFKIDLSFTKNIPDKELMEIMNNQGFLKIKKNKDTLIVFNGKETDKSKFKNDLKFQVFKELEKRFSVGHPCALPGGTKSKFSFIFSSDMPGGYGGKDLWLASFSYGKNKTTKKKEWKRDTMYNLGANINTKGDELFPTLGAEGQLYFSSNGMVGIGGLDIFYVEKTEEKWSGEAINMGVPLNSNKNDYALYDIDGVSGYFTSEKGGDPDIYSYKLPPNLFEFRVVVEERGTGKRIPKALVKLVCTTDGKEITSKNASGTGRVRWEKMPNGNRIILANKEYKVFIDKQWMSENNFVDDGKGVIRTTVGLKRGKTLNATLTLLSIKKEIKLTEVQYVFNKWEFINDATCMSMDSIKETFDMLKDFPSVVIEIYSHTDARGNAQKNETLSENRARKYYTELINMGIDPRRIKPVGKGETEPRVWKDPETGQVVTLNEKYINQFKKSDKKKFEYLHQLNRRTTAKVIQKDFDPNASPVPSLEEVPYYDKYLKY
ncbi:MAG: OmpA family protein [Crocinitomicaceae bacterium]|nr:OmpA family protein [Crocinitomicaceae bacterium]